MQKKDAGTDGTGLFIYEFFALVRETQKDYQNLETNILETGISRLENFSINSESAEFADLIEDVFGECEFYDKDMEDELFRFLIELRFLEIKEYVVKTTE